MTTTTRDLLARLADLLRNERCSMADFLVTLADFDQRRCWIELGYASLFDFLHRELGLSKGTAFYRKVAAELIQQYPEIVEPLRDGRLCITATHALSRAITTENRAEVLPRFFHLSKQDALAVAAELAPASLVPRKTVVTTVRVAASRSPAPSVPATQADCSVPPAETNSRNSQPVGRFCLEGTGSAAASEARRTVVVPLTATDRRIHITVSPAFLAKVEQARLALSHTMPAATDEAVLSAGLDLLLARDAKKKALVARLALGDAVMDRYTAATTGPRVPATYLPASAVIGRDPH